MLQLEETAKQYAVNKSNEDNQNPETNKNLKTSATVLLIVARLCHGLTNVCPHLRVCANATLLTQVRSISLYNFIL